MHNWNTRWRDRTERNEYLKWERLRSFQNQWQTGNNRSRKHRTLWGIMRINKQNRHNNKNKAYQRKHQKWHLNVYSICNKSKRNKQKNSEKKRLGSVEAGRQVRNLTTVLIRSVMNFGPPNMQEEERVDQKKKKERKKQLLWL